jgi:phosphatidylglycerophosphate synthase
MSAVREWAASQNTQVLEVSPVLCYPYICFIGHSKFQIFSLYFLQQAVAVNNLGKWKTATQMIALTLLLASRDPRYLPFFLVKSLLLFSLSFYHLHADLDLCFALCCAVYLYKVL